MEVHGERAEVEEDVLLDVRRHRGVRVEVVAEPGVAPRRVGRDGDEAQHGDPEAPDVEETPSGDRHEAVAQSSPSEVRRRHGEEDGEE